MKLEHRKRKEGIILNPFDDVLKVDLKINDDVFIFTIFIEYQNVILATILGELVRIKLSRWNINFPLTEKGEHYVVAQTMGGR